jgi:hypothetical protein
MRQVFAPNDTCRFFLPGPHRPKPDEPAQSAAPKEKRRVMNPPPLDSIPLAEIRIPS